MGTRNIKRRDRNSGAWGQERWSRNNRIGGGIGTYSRRRDRNIRGETGTLEEGQEHRRKDRNIGGGTRTLEDE